MNIEISNSFCKVVGADANTHDLIERVLTYKNDIGAEKAAMFGRIQMGKRFKNQKMVDDAVAKIKQLEANEWVCWYKNHSFPTGLLNIVKDVLKEAYIQYKLEDLRVLNSKRARILWKVAPYQMRYYQQAMFDLGIQEHRGVFESAVGTGKSLILSYLVQELDTISLIIVPSRGLLDQMHNELAKWFGKNKVGVVDTRKVRAGTKLKNVRICTVQTLAALNKTGDLKHVTDDVGALFVDEIHHAGATSYLDLLSHLDHVYYRFGFTGTFLRNDGRAMDMWGFLSNVLYRYPAHQAIQEGFLTPLEVKVYDLPGRAHSKYQKEYDNNYCGNPDLLRKVEEIIRASNGDQVLVLVNKKDKAGKIFHEYLNSLGVDNVYISGDNKKEEITKAINGFNDKEFQVLIGSSVIGEGIDVRSTDHLIMCQGGKSEIVMVQAIGRAVRLYEGKSIAYVHDFRFKGTKYMNKHLEIRKNVYTRNFECPINTFP